MHRPNACNELNVKLRFIMMISTYRILARFTGIKGGWPGQEMNTFEQGTQIQILAETAKRSALPLPHIPVFIYGKHAA